MSEKIKVRNLGKSLDGKTILRGIDVTIPKGEIFTIVGPSGAGKSMFLRTLNRLIDPEAGEILLDGVSIFSMDPREVRRKVGMVFQIPILFEGTVADNILMGPRIRGKELTTGEARDIVRRSLDSVHLPQEVMDKDAAKLSVGEQQRVCIARALANDPEVILMDEPTASLDPTTTLKIESLISSLNEELGLTFVVVTHDMAQARRIGTTTMILKAGKVLDLDRTEEIFSKTNLHTRDLVGGEEVREEKVGEEEVC